MSSERFGRAGAGYPPRMGDITNTCPVCGATFDDDAELNRHLEEHKDQPVQTE